MLRSDLFLTTVMHLLLLKEILPLQIQPMMHVTRNLLLKYCTIISCISKISNALFDNAEDLDLVMPMCNLLEYSKNDRKTTGSLWNYYRDEPNRGAEGNINYSIKNSNLLVKKQALEGNN